MTIENLEKELKNNQIQSLYLLYGEEQFLLESCIKKIKNIFGECIKGINYINIDDTNVKELLNEIETPAFGYEKKLIVVRNTQLLKKEGKRKNEVLTKLKNQINETILQNIETIKKSVVLIFIEEEVDEKLELYKTIDKYGVICKFDFQKPYQLEKRLKAICNRI